MRRLLLVILMLGVASYAMAASTSNVQPVKVPSGISGDQAMSTRTGGEDIGTATVIGGLPYSDSDATGGHINDYTDCVSNSAPDVVYVYTPSADGNINVSLCGSGYDTVLYLYAGGYTPGAPYACNDDFCSVQSEIDNIPVTAGVPYYIVVDGYSSAYGSYVLNVTAVEPCVVECPAGAALENEPDCYDGYWDTTDGGCNSSGWITLEAQADNCGILCGKSGTYLYGGYSYRDTDWYSCTSIGGLNTMDCVGEFPIQIIMLYAQSGVISCQNYTYVYTTAAMCANAHLQVNLAQGAIFWPWVGPSVFAGVPCGSDYVMNVCGITGGQPPVPTQNTSWGTIKHLYK